LSFYPKIKLILNNKRDKNLSHRDLIGTQYDVDRKESL